MPPDSGRVLLLTPEGRDAEVASAILRNVGITSRAVRVIPELIEHLPEASCAVVSAEGLLRADRQELAAWINSQPPWSDFPFVLLTFRGAAPDPRLVELLGNVTILERPFHPNVLVNAVRSAARARRRQREAELYLDERRRSEEHKEILIRELHHRVKNMLATVQALIRAATTAVGSVAEFRDILSARLQSLAQTHDLLLAGDWQAVPLREILRGELSPFGDGMRIQLEGPEVELPPDLALALGMAFHELATNAAKYGALSTPAGRLEVNWEIRADDTELELALRWVERDGPSVTQPGRQGFGTKLIQRMLGSRKGAGFSFDFQPSGLEFGLTLSLEQQPSAGIAGVPARIPAVGPLGA